MPDDASSPANRWPLALGVLALVGVGIWWLFSDTDPEPPPAPPPEPAEEADTRPPPPVEDEPMPEPEEPRDFDRDRLARMLRDGSVEVTAEETAAIYAPEPPTRGVEEPLEVALERQRRFAEETAAVPADERPPPTPQQQLRQATFWRGMLDDRIDAAMDALEVAEREGDTAAANRHRRIIARLRAQRPAVNSQIERLQYQLGDPDDVPADSE